MNSKIVNFLLFQFAWFSCAVGVGNDFHLLSLLALVFVISIHLYFSKFRRRDILFLLVVGILGSAIDSSLGWFSILDFNGQWFCPLWLSGLWMVFASTIHYSLSWLSHRYISAAVLGAIAGPGSYYAGASFGALNFGVNTQLSLVVLAIVWGIVLPLMFVGSKYLFQPK